MPDACRARPRPSPRRTIDLHNEQDGALDVEGAPPRSARRALFSYILRIVVSCGIIVLIVRTVSWTEILSTARAADLRRLLLAWTLVIPVVLVKGFKWQILLRQVEIRIPFSAAVASFLAGMGMGMLTPGKVGEVARIWGLGLSREEAVTAGTMVVVDRATNLVALLLLVLPGIGFFFGGGALAIGAITMLTGWAVLFWLLRGGRPTHWQGRFNSRMLRAGVRALTAHPPGALLTYTFLDMTVAFSAMVQIYILVNALGSARFLSCLIGLPIVFCNSIIPISAGGVGVREALMTIVFGPLGVPPAVAVPAIFLYFVQSVLTMGLVGLVVAVARRPRPAAGSE